MTVMTVTAVPTTTAATTEATAKPATAVVASTLTTVAVFFPMVFISGVAGQLFRDQALTEGLQESERFKELKQAFDRLVEEGLLEPLPPIERHPGRAYRVVP